MQEDSRETQGLQRHEGETDGKMWQGISEQQMAHMSRTRARIPHRGDDAGGHKIEVLAQVVDVTQNLASVMEMVDRGLCVIFHKECGCIQTM